MRDSATGRRLRDIHPTAHVMLIDDSYDADDDLELWARLTIGWLGAAPDAVFTSESHVRHGNPGESNSAGKLRNRGGNRRTR